METKGRVFFFNYLMTQQVLAATSEKQLERILRSRDISRMGQEWTFRMAAKSFAPCLVNGNHWAGLRIDADELKKARFLEVIFTVTLKQLTTVGDGRYSSKAYQYFCRQTCLMCFPTCWMYRPRKFAGMRAVSLSAR